MMTGRQVFNDYSPQLVSALPMKDPIFIARLAQRGRFFGNLKAEVIAKSTPAEAVAHFLEKAIECYLLCDDTEPLKRLLFVMEEFSEPLKRLSREISQSLCMSGQLLITILLVYLHI